MSGMLHVVFFIPENRYTDIRIGTQEKHIMLKETIISSCLQHPLSDKSMARQSQPKYLMQITWIQMRRRVTRRLIKI